MRHDEKNIEQELACIYSPDGQCILNAYTPSLWKDLQYFTNNTSTYKKQNQGLSKGSMLVILQKSFKLLICACTRTEQPLTTRLRVESSLQTTGQHLKKSPE
jgi:hypothetical protein